MATIHYIRQGEAAGLGHAVAVAEPHVGGEPFAVLLGDDLIHPSVPLLAQMLRVVEKYGRSVIAAQEVPLEDISLYGCITPEPVDDNLARVRSIVEKPSPEDAPSNLAAIGRYVFTPEIFASLRETKPGKGDEIQLTDAINLLAQEQAVYAYIFDSGRYDVGNKIDYLQGHRRVRDRARPTSVPSSAPGSPTSSTEEARLSSFARGFGEAAAQTARTWPPRLLPPRPRSRLR